MGRCPREEERPLRGGAALLVAGLAAQGMTRVGDIHHIQRGYEGFDEKLRRLGAVIELADSDREVQKFRLKIG